ELFGVVHNHDRHQDRVFRGSHAGERGVIAAFDVASGFRIDLLGRTGFTRDRNIGVANVACGSVVDDAGHHVPQGAGRTLRQHASHRAHGFGAYRPPFSVDPRLHEPRTHQRAVI